MSALAQILDQVRALFEPRDSRLDKLEERVTALEEAVKPSGAPKATRGAPVAAKARTAHIKGEAQQP